MPKMSAQQAASKWSRNLGAATEDMRQGIERVTESPTEAAADNLEKAKRRYAEAVDSGKMADGLRSVSLSEWKAAALNKGVDRVAQGASQAQDKVANRLSPLFDHIQRGEDAVADMPDNTDADSDARMLAFARHMRTYRRG